MTFSSDDRPGAEPAASAGPSASMQPPQGLTARDRSRRRKWIYGLSMIVLIVILFALGEPATLGRKDVPGQQDVPGQPGGVLAYYRDTHGLSQTELGQIDPTSETIRLATLGMRGIAVELLWIKANQYQMKKDWTRLRATLDQISKLQPHSINVWRYQAWNLSYNVSVAFDDYHDKFYWVIEGLNFMLQGVKANDREPRLYWDMAWFLSNKIGRDDAAKYYRRLFSGERQPDGKDAPEYVKDFREHFTPPGGFPPDCNLRDNWHIGKAWFKAAEDKINPPRYPVRGMAPVIFYSDAPTCQFYYADNLEKDGFFGQVAKLAWKQAENEWHTFGERDIVSSDVTLQLNRREDLYDSAQEKREQLYKMVPGVREALEKERRVKLSPEEKIVWDQYRADVEKYQKALEKYKAEKKKNPKGKNEKPLLQPTLDGDMRDRAEAKPDEIARRAPPDQRQAAMALAKEIEEEDQLARDVNRERMKVNFDFWRTRAKAEQTDDCIAAREAMYDADVAFNKGDLIRARPAYEKSMLLWRKVLDVPELHPLVDDVSLGGDLMDDIRRYQKCLDQDDLDLSPKFPLQEIVAKHGARQGAVPVDARSSPAAPTPPPKSSSSKPAVPNAKGSSASSTSAPATSAAAKPGRS
jgi:hypothetical protein